MASYVQTNNKRTFYKILQISDDADIDAIDAAYQRLKMKYLDMGDASVHSELLFIEHAYETLSDPDKRKTYDMQIAHAVKPTVVQYEQYAQSGDGWFSSSKLIVVMLCVLAIVAYGLNTRHSEEIGKIDVAKEAVVGAIDVSRENVQNDSKAIDTAASIAQRQLEIQRQDADLRRMEAENRIRINEEANRQRLAAQAAAQQATAERAERCRYMNSLITQARNAGAYSEAMSLQAKGCY